MENINGEFKYMSARDIYCAEETPTKRIERYLANLVWCIADRWSEHPDGILDNTHATLDGLLNGIASGTWGRCWVSPASIHGDHPYDHLEMRVHNSNSTGDMLAINFIHTQNILDDVSIGIMGMGGAEKISSDSLTFSVVIKPDNMFIKWHINGGSSIVNLVRVYNDIINTLKVGRTSTT